jgi:hypothetical protein
VAAAGDFRELHAVGGKVRKISQRAVLGLGQELLRMTKRAGRGRAAGGTPWMASRRILATSCPCPATSSG